MKKARLTITQREPAYPFYRHALTEENLKETFDHFLKTYPSFKREELSVSIDYSHGYYDEIDIDVYVNGTRQETDEEYFLRMEKEEAKRKRDSANAAKSRKKAKEEKEAKDLAEYIRLKEKYEGIKK